MLWRENAGGRCSGAKQVITCQVRMKLLQFRENVRPSYYGTWRQEAGEVSGRRPFGSAPKIDYDYDR